MTKKAAGENPAIFYMIFIKKPPIKVSNTFYRGFFLYCGLSIYLIDNKKAEIITAFLFYLMPARIHDR